MQCERRCWLLERLGIRLDFRARDLACLWALLELPDRELIDAVGGRRREELHEAYATWEGNEQQADDEVESICMHDAAYPRCLRGDALAPQKLCVRGGLARLNEGLEQKVVAVVGTRKATDYGMQTARGLSRELASCGLTVVGGLGEGIAGAVQSGVLEAGAKPIGVLAGSLRRCSPACCEPQYRRVLERGCAVSEQPATLRPCTRSWWATAAERTMALLSDLTIVVEAGEHPRELACARVAWTRGKHVACVPGRVSSPASKGTNELLMHGARLVRDTQDVLDILYGVGGLQARERTAEPETIEPRLAKVLAGVAAGRDTIEKLSDIDFEPGQLALALAELELTGMLVRGDGGRYLAGGA